MLVRREAIGGSSRGSAPVSDAPTVDLNTADSTGLLALPGVVITDTGEERLERAKAVLLRLIDQACVSVQAMREREGRTLHEDLSRHCGEIAAHLEVIAERAPAVVDEYQERLKQRITTMLAETSAAVRDEDGLTVAYVQIAGESFERRAVVVGPSDGEWVLVRSGVRRGWR